MLECAKRTNSRPRTKKDIISSDHLKELCNMFSDSSDVIVLRDLRPKKKLFCSGHPTLPNNMRRPYRFFRFFGVKKKKNP
jgi:hypothetical protein